MTEEMILEKERQEGVKQERERVASDLLKEGGMTASFISRISKLPETAVRELAQKMAINLSD